MQRLTTACQSHDPWQKGSHVLWEKPILNRAWLSSTPIDQLDQIFDSSFKLAVVLHHSLYFFLVMIFLYDQLLLATVMALKTNPPLVIHLPNHLQSDNFINHKSHLTSYLSRCFMEFGYSLSSTYTWYCTIQQSLQKLTNSFWLYPSHFLLVHTPQ